MLSGLYQLKNMKIHDDLLSKGDFANLKNYILGSNFPWYKGYIVDQNHKLLCDPLDNIQFYCWLYYDNRPQTGEYKIVEPIIYHPELKIASVIRVKANMNLRTNKVIEHGYHTDGEFQCKTAVYYINTNDGYTAFEDGTQVESIENRLVVFDSQIKHTGSTCTNDQYRCVINFNYFEKVL